ncbi:chaperone protein dnaJ 11, chloroplastic-like [Telopea speciosissima]|uniref:chaperone protein dnaJ 11, chloroplastic-like n=1 Tax=Telopea speciosissima TaxID=54955 RepID=UPI001CC7D117|nr:chaperone protein dnaJ 11, chloroplastic-like [Telopea speciosissima]
MFGSCAIATGTTTQFLSGTRLSFEGTSRSSSSGGSMSFTGAGRSSCPYRFTIEAFAETTTGSSSSSRTRIEAMKPMATNLYEVLCVKETASQVEIKSAYRSLAKLHHPDAATSGSDARDFIEIHNAYATLSDPTARARYDLSIGGRRHFSFSSSSASGGAGGGTRSGFVVGRTRRWETDQCW